MPYNTTAIPPRKEATGQAQLPLARVKKIIALDAEISQCSTHAAFVMTLAAEMFIQFLAEHGHRVAKSERKPRRNIQYADIANAVQRLNKTEFLTDIVPRTVPYKRIVERKAREEKVANAAAATAAASQSTLDNGVAAPMANGTNGTSTESPAPGSTVEIVDLEKDESVEVEDPNAQLEREIRARSEKFGGVNGNGNGHVDDEDEENDDDEDEDEDVEMAD